jgi:hypothetical protein
MTRNKAFSITLGGTLALAVCGAATAQDLGVLENIAGGESTSFLSGSTGNVAGIVEFCVKNNYLSSDAAGGIKDQLLGKLGGEDESAEDKAGYEDGAMGLLKTADGETVDLADAGAAGGVDMGNLKAKVTEKACSAVLDQAKSLL